MTKIALLQLNPIVSDIVGNADKIIKTIEKNKENNISLFVTSELTLLGYPAKDLLLDKSFINFAWEKTKELAKILKDYPPLILGTATFNKIKVGKPLFNSAVLLREGKIEKIFYKTLLPTYDVFDEHRYFESGEGADYFTLENLKIGVTICEDIWNDKDFWQEKRWLYPHDPIKELAGKNVNLIINISASPFSIGKQKFREKMFSNTARKYNLPVIYVNQVGGNDDLVFDGRSCVFDRKGDLVAKASAFAEDILIYDNQKENVVRKDDFAPESEAYKALVLGTRDYLSKIGFKKALVGLSGGIDSSLVCCIAVEAIGKDNILGVLMPSVYSRVASMEDAKILVDNLKIKTLKIEITDLMKSYDKALLNAFEGYKKDVTEENIQARIRGNLLMALSNKYNALLLSTGNKSELSVGYCTLYGDLSGGLAVISDVPKTMVYRIANWLNKEKKDIIPREIIQKSPSAELKPNQKDEDILPPYDVLDGILDRFVEFHKSQEEIVKDGFDPEMTAYILNLVKKAEFKRKQAPPGIKITDRAFGTGWRMPVAAKI